MNALPDTTQSQNPDPAWQTELIRRKWLSEYTFELEFRRPDTFQFAAGQTVILIHEDTERHYSLVSAPHEPNFRLCLRHIHAGKISSILAAAEPGKQFTFKGPRGYFTFKPSSRSAVFIATGVGIAPFVSMAKSGVTGFTLLHGVKSAQELYYTDILRTPSLWYIPCISRPKIR